MQFSKNGPLSSIASPSGSVSKSEGEGLMLKLLSLYPKEGCELFTNQFATVGVMSSSEDIQVIVAVLKTLQRDYHDASLVRYHHNHKQTTNVSVNGPTSENTLMNRMSVNQFDGNEGLFEMFILNSMNEGNLKFVRRFLFDYARSVESSQWMDWFVLNLCRKLIWNVTNEISILCRLDAKKSSTNPFYVSDYYSTHPEYILQLKNVCKLHNIYSRVHYAVFYNENPSPHPNSGKALLPWKFYFVMIQTKNIPPVLFHFFLKNWLKNYNIYDHQMDILLKQMKAIKADWKFRNATLQMVYRAGPRCQLSYDYKMALNCFYGSNPF